MTRPARARGFTLVELVVSLAVSMVVIAAASMLLVAQQRAHAAGSGQRALQETARVALSDITRRLRDAGYGVDPAAVLDFGPQDNVPRASLFTGGKEYLTSYRCNTAVTCRDKTDASDEIVFYSRDPLFSRPVAAVGAGSVTLVGDLKEPLYAGQILQVMCLLDPRTMAYVTVGRFVPAAAPPNPLNNVVVPLAPGQTGGALGLPAFPFENGELASPCFGSGVAAVVATKMDRFRYYVDSYTEDGAAVAPQTAGSRPHLMLDQGLLDAGGNPIVSPVAPDVEDVQFAYLYPPLAAGGGSRLVGMQQGTDAGSEPGGIDVLTPPPAIGDAPDAPSRRTGNPANILGVRISVLVRSPEQDLNQSEVAVPVIPAVANRTPQAAIPKYRRSLFETTVMLRNVQGRGILYPVVDATGATAGALLGGG